MSSYQQTCENCFQDTIIKVGVSDLRALLKQCFGGTKNYLSVQMSSNLQIRRIPFKYMIVYRRASPISRRTQINANRALQLCTEMHLSSTEDKIKLQ